MQPPAAQLISESGSRPAQPGWLRRLWLSFQPWNLPVEEAATVPPAPLTSHLRLGVLSRYCLVTIVLSLLLVRVSYQIYQLQVKRHNEFLNDSLVLCRTSDIKTAQRGSIFDRRGNLLAVEVATCDVLVEAKRFSTHLDEITRILARNLRLDEAGLRRQLTGTTSYEAPVTLEKRASREFVESNGLQAIPGVVLSENFHAEEGKQASLRVSFHPYMLEETARRHSIQRLARIFDMREEDLRKKCENAHARGREITIARKVPREEAMRMMDELRSFWRTVEPRKGISGVRLSENWKRIYPLDSEMANLLGYVNDFEEVDCTASEVAGLVGNAKKVTVARGMSGIESLMDAYLRPSYGKFTYKHYRGGRPAEEGFEYLIRPQKGADVYLTIDEPIQQIVEEELAALCEKHVPDHAYAIMLDPSTGAVMAVAQYPQFNPNDRRTYAPERTRNHFLAVSYEPGSIMKPVSLSSVLGSRQATLDTPVDCEKGVWYFGGKALHDSHAVGMTTFAGVIEQSSNIGTAKLAVNLGSEAMYRHLRNFGLGERTGLGFYPEGKTPVVFKGEDRGRFREYRHWDKLSITRFPIGQGVQVTPMQIIMMWSALANRGVIMQPYIVDCVRYADGTVEYSQPHVKYQAIAPEVAGQMTEALKMVTTGEHGTGRRAALKDFTVAGKTGTAQMWINADKEKGILGHYSNKDYFASFVGFVPADQPRFLLLVSVDHPTQSGHTGSNTAAPVFKRIAERTLEYLQVPSDAESAQRPIAGAAQR
ncbi:MAG: penicillin-binding protein 2 [Victivallales bacterium]|nr:penicillin-binding protein 2 [Victivallales bacterium]